MNLSSFSILTGLVLLYAGLTISETTIYRKWENAQREQHDIQLKVNYFRHMNETIQQMVGRLASESRNDPALAELLKQRRINVVVSNGDIPADSSDPAQTHGQAPADKAVPAPEPAHP